jgi:hypothetical protein
LKHTEAGFSMISTDSLYLRVTQMPRSQNLVIFAGDRQTTDKLIALPLLRMRAHGVISGWAKLI